MSDDFFNTKLPLAFLSLELKSVLFNHFVCCLSHSVRLDVVFFIVTYFVIFINKEAIIFVFTFLVGFDVNIKEV